jgi:general secretion pathway protein G
VIRLASPPARLLRSLAAAAFRPIAFVVGVAALVLATPLSRRGSLPARVVGAGTTALVCALALLVVPPAEGRTDARQKAKVDIKSIGDAIHLYKIKRGTWPASLGDLVGCDALIQDRASSAELRDPWGTPYLYIPPATSHDIFDVVSLGADGRPGGEGDAADIHLADARVDVAD